MNQKIREDAAVSLELINEEVTEVVNSEPKGVIRYGNTLILAVLALILFVSYFIRYPDIIIASATIVAQNPPKSINAKSEGKLERLFIGDGDHVKKGAHLGFVQSPTDYNEVMQLRSVLDTFMIIFSDRNFNKLDLTLLPKFESLGELQNAYQVFQNELLQTQQTISNGYYIRKKESLLRDLSQLGQLKKIASQQKILTNEDLKLQEKEYNTFEKLEKEKVIAPIELNQYKSRLIAKEQNLKQIESQITNGSLAIQSKEKELLDLNKSILDQEQSFYTALYELKSQTDQWIQRYVFVAPEDGKVVYSDFLHENEYLRDGQTLFYVQPLRTSYYAELLAPQKGLGRVAIGQKVKLKVESSPSEEYGILQGRISYIGSIPSRKDSFLLRVDLQNNLTTNYDRQIDFKNNLTAVGEIITENRRLLERLTGKLKKLFSNV
jgi:multidrug resistance efflux pump